MKDGRKIRICDMSSRHISHSIEMIHKIFHVTLAAGERTLCMLQGDMAIYYMEKDLDNLQPEDVCPLYDDLIEELASRMEKSKSWEYLFS